MTMNYTDYQKEVARYFSISEEKLFMTIDQAEAVSAELGRRLYRKYPEVDCIVGIANGGLLPAYIVSKTMKLPLKIIDIRRRGSSIKHKLFRLAPLSNLIFALYQLQPIRRVMGPLSNRLAVPVVRQSPQIKSIRNCALVDDAIETGRTLARAKMILEKQGLRNIVTAAISWSHLYTDTSYPPDIHICRRVHHYPWSGNNPEYKKYQSWLKNKDVKCLP